MILPHDASRLWKTLYVIATILKPLFFHLKVEGRENVPAEGGCILVSNHTRGPDFLVLAYACPRQVFYMAKMEIFRWNPLLTKLFVSAGVFPVRRGQSDLLALNAAVSLVQQGHVVGMFPEGTRSSNGILQKGKSGAARIAMQSEAPLVPVVVLNAEKVFEGFGRRLRRPEVIVRFGKPFCVSGDNSDPAATRHHTEKIMQAIAALLPPERRGEFTTAHSTKT